VIVAETGEWCLAGFADGGAVGSRPYAASGAYSNRMSKERLAEIAREARAILDSEAFAASRDYRSQTRLRFWPRPIFLAKAERVAA